MARWVGAVLVLGLLVGCGDPAGPFGGDVRASFWPAGLAVVNHRPTAIHYLVVEREMTALIDWVPCVDDRWGPCPRIGPGALRVIPFDSIPGWEDTSDEVVFYWWHVVEPPGGPAVDSIRTIVVGWP